MNDGAKHFIDALKDMGIDPIMIDLGEASTAQEFASKVREVLDGPCPVHGNGPCPKVGSAADMIPDAAEAMRIAKVALAGAVQSVNDPDANKSFLRLAVADTAIDLYDRLLAAEERAKLDGEWGMIPGDLGPDLRTETEREADLNAAMSRAEAEGDRKETAEEYAARYRKAEREGRLDDPETGL